jgi:hypothetical protein
MASRLTPLHAVHADENLIQIPGIAGSGPPAAQSHGEFKAQLGPPAADTFASDHDTAFGQVELDITETEAEEMIQPHGMTDNFRRKAMAALQGWLRDHANSLTRPQTSHG